MEQQKLFSFDKKDVESYIRFELNTFRRYKKSFDYVYETLSKLGFHYDATNKKNIAFHKMKVYEGKNYNWFAVSYKESLLIFRQYGLHYTIYANQQKDIDRGIYSRSTGCATFYTNTDVLLDDEQIKFYDNPFAEINKVFLDMAELINQGNIHSLWNDVTFKRDSINTVKVAFRNEEIYSFDESIFCFEELSDIELCLFAENDMLEKLKTIKHRIGNTFRKDSVIEDIVTDFPEQYSDPYYHGVGIKLKTKNGGSKFIDVYSLTMWYMDDIFVVDELEEKKS